jgi:ribosomal protein S1
MKNLHPGALVDGIVIDIHKFGARIKIKETDIRWDHVIHILHFWFPLLFNSLFFPPPYISA